MPLRTDVFEIRSFHPLTKKIKYFFLCFLPYATNSTHIASQYNKLDQMEHQCLVCGIKEYLVNWSSNHIKIASILTSMLKISIFFSCTIFKSSCVVSSFPYPAQLQTYSSHCCRPLPSSGRVHRLLYSRFAARWTPPLLVCLTLPPGTRPPPPRHPLPPPPRDRGNGSSDSVQG